MAQQHYKDVILAASPDGYWPLSETSGTNADDASSGAHDGTVNGAITLNQTGTSYIGPAFSSDAASGKYVNVGDYHSYSGTANMTVECWVKPNGASVTGRMVSKEVAFSSPVKGWTFCLAGNKLYYARSGSGGAYRDLIGTTTLSNGTWYHVAVTYASTGTFKVYVNGVDDGGTYSGTLTSAYSLVAPTDPLRFFAASDSVSGSNANCQLMHVAVYGSTLSAATLLDHYRQGAGINATVIAGPAITVALIPAPCR